MGAISIRGYEDKDLQACRDLWVELTDRHRLIYENDSIGGDNPGLQFDDHLAAVGSDRLWVAVDGPEVVGLTGLIASGSEGEVEPAVVTENRRGEGIGSALIETVTAAARAAGVRLLSVRPVARNADAVRFFREAGFDVLGHIEAFMDLTGEPRRWRPGEIIADREFDV